MYNVFRDCFPMAFFTNTISVITIVSVGVGISIVVVSIFMGDHKYKNHKYLLDSDSSSSETSTDDSTHENLENNCQEKYEDKYLTEYKNLENNDIDCENINFIEDNTPNGIVKMSYDINKNSFIYYTNNKDNMPYKYLETVARLFIINNDCKNIYINYEEELNKAIHKLETSKESDTTKELETTIEDQSEYNEQHASVELKPQENVFAKLKNYKTTFSNTCKKKWIIPERINQYKYKGKIKDYDEYIETLSSPNSDNDFECLDYSTFKIFHNNKTLT